MSKLLISDSDLMTIELHKWDPGLIEIIETFKNPKKVYSRFVKYHTYDTTKQERFNRWDKYFEKIGE
jgi:hypothetical protein